MFATFVCLISESSIAYLQLVQNATATGARMFEHITLILALPPQTPIHLWIYFDYIYLKCTLFGFLYHSGCWVLFFFLKEIVFFFL